MSHGGEKLPQKGPDHPAPRPRPGFPRGLHTPRRLEDREAGRVVGSTKLHAPTPLATQRPQGTGSDGPCTAQPIPELG